MDRTIFIFDNYVSSTGSIIIPTGNPVKSNIAVSGDYSREMGHNFKNPLVPEKDHLGIEHQGAVPKKMIFESPDRNDFSPGRGGVFQLMSTPANSNGATEKRHCRNHIKCKDASEEHTSQFICVYQKSCRFGSRCNKQSDSEHLKYFSHGGASQKNGGKSKEADEPRGERKVKPRLPHLTEDNSHDATVNYNLSFEDAYGNKSKFEDTIRIRILKTATHPQIEEIAIKAIRRKHIGRTTIRNQELTLDVDCPFEDGEVDLNTASLPIPVLDKALTS